MATARNEGFIIYAPEPVDGRTLVQNYAALGTVPLPYNHMLVHVVSEDADYRYYTGTKTWVKVTSTGYAVWSQIQGDPEDSSSLVAFLNANYLPISYVPPPTAPLAHTHPTTDIEQTNGTYLFGSTITATNFILRGSFESNGAGDSNLFRINGDTTTQQIPLGSTVFVPSSEITVSEGIYTLQYNETDPTVPDHVKAISQEDVDKWNTSLGATRTSDLINDGEDGTSRYVTEAELQGGQTVTSDLDDASTIATNWYTELVGQQLSVIQGMNITQLMEFILFQTVLAFISRPKSASIAVSGTDSEQELLEVGTAYSWTLTGSLDQGEITDGTGLVNGPLVGAANPTNAYSFTGTGIVSPIITSSSFVVINDSIDFGNNRWDVTISHLPGTGDYYNNKNEVGSNLETERASGSVTSPISRSVEGIYPYFFGMSASDFTSDGTALYTSGEMTKLIEKVGNKTVNLRGASKRIYYAFPASYPVLTRILDGNEDNVIGGFNVDTILLTSVGQGTDWSVSYRVYSSLISTVDNNGNSIPYTFIHAG